MCKRSQVTSLLEQIEPTIEQSFGPTVSVARQIDHTAAGHSCRGRVAKVMSLEQHVHRLGHLDDFTIHQTQSFVIIQHCVHVLNPICVHRTIKYDPSSLLEGCLRSTESENCAKNSVSEFLRNGVVVAVELGKTDTFRIDHIGFHFELLKAWVLLCYLGDRLCKYFVSRGLTAICCANKHHPVSTLYHVVNLNYLFNERWLLLEIHILQDLVDALLQRWVGYLRQLYLWEQIFDNAFKKWDVFSLKFRKIHVSYASQNQHIFGFVDTGSRKRSLAHVSLRDYTAFPLSLSW